MTVVHARVHSLSSLGRMSMTSVSDNEDPFLHRKFGSNPLPNCPTTLAFWIGKQFTEMPTAIDRPPMEFIWRLDRIRIKCLSSYLIEDLEKVSENKYEKQLTSRSWCGPVLPLSILPLLDNPHLSSN